MQQSDKNGPKMDQGTGVLESHLQDLSIGNSQQNNNGSSNAISHSRGGLPKQGPAPAKSSHKRPNQAQRRQMSSQMTIPIDTRSRQSWSQQQSAAVPPQSNQNQYSRAQGTSYDSPAYAHTFSQQPGSGYGRPPHNTQPQFRQPQNRQAHPPYMQGGAHQSRPQGNWTHGQESHHPIPGGVGPDNSSRGQRQGYSNQYHPHQRVAAVNQEDLRVQASMLEHLCQTIIADAEIEPSDILEKEQFRARLEHICQGVISEHEEQQAGQGGFPALSIQLKCFGSLASGFATKAADMDLGLLSPVSPLQPDAPGSPIPRLLEKVFLDMGLGARLLTRTRVPIIKICQRPPPQLLADLREERRKWETGDVEDPTEGQEPNEGHEQQEDDPSPSTPGEEQIAGVQQQDNGLKKAPTRESTYEETLATLQQGKKSLQNYFNMAKGVLRKVDARDITHYNASEFSQRELQILNDVALATIDGLADEGLRSRLLAYPSLNRDELKSGKQFRSLYGVLSQIEGEHMVSLWENRELAERDDYHEYTGVSVLKAWRFLQNKPNFGADPVAYGRDLHSAMESVKKIPSIQLMDLSQAQYETATAYYARTAQILTDLKSKASPEVDVVSPVVVRQYIHGIHGKEMQTDVAQYAEAGEPKSLQTVARRHKGLQLALHFEKALEKDLYTAEQAVVVSNYVQLLRSASDNPSSFVPVTHDNLPLIYQVRDLGDPSKLPPNQPRDPYKDRLEFPKDGTGVQCDINFSAHLALHNTLLLRCYSHCDPRVRPLVLFVKHWAKARGINTPYRGTLSSYGYVLMMLHYLVNVAQPGVCGNLQQMASNPPLAPNMPPEQWHESVCKGYDVRFWRDEDHIKHLAALGRITQNQDSIGLLLRGFFEYYAQSYNMTTVQGRGFDWGRDVLSLRTLGGLLSKNEKGWTGARTTVEVKATAAPPGTGGTAGATDAGPGPSTEGPNTVKEVREIRHRYLFAIEDPFELNHNVARTVTHNGIVSIRDEFRRAWRIIKNAQRPSPTPEDLLEDVVAAEQRREKQQFSFLLADLHGLPDLPEVTK